MHNDRRALVAVPIRVEFADKTANIMSSTMEISRSASLVTTKPKLIGSSFKFKWKSFRARTHMPARKSDDSSSSDGGGGRTAGASGSDDGASDGDDCTGDSCGRRSSRKSSRRNRASHRRSRASSRRRRNSPIEEFFIMDSFSDGAYVCDELPVKICKEVIRQCLLENFRQLRTSDALLVDMENARLDLSADGGALQSLSAGERNYAFLWAAFVGRLDYMEALHEQGANLAFATPGEGGYKALHLSAFSGCVNCVRWLIERGVDANDVTHDMFTPLHYTVLGNSLESLNFLANVPGVRIPDTVLHTAVLANAIDCVHFLLNMGADVAAYDKCGMTPLHVAADRSLVQCLRVLLERQPDAVDVKTHSRRATALHLACENGHHECAKLLLEHGASCAERNCKGQTALHLAAKAHSYECADELLRADADVNARDLDQRTPLHSAVCKPQLAFAMLELLTARNAEVNVADRYGYTPLHLAAYNELADCVDFLIMRGANVGARTDGGSSALSIINRKTPTSVQAIRKKLDESLSVTEPDGRNNRELRLKLDLRYIKQNSTCGEIGFLQMLKKEGHRELLEHPLCVAFLHLKWEKVRTYYFIRLTFCTFFIVFLSLYVMTALAHDCYNAAEYARRRHQLHEALTAAANQSIANCTANSLAGAYLIDNQWLMEYIWYALVGCTLLELVRKLYSTPGYSSLRQYLKSLSNVIEWVVLASVLAVSFAFFAKIGAWQKQVGAFAVLAGWSILMIMIGQLPVFGTYIAMYTKVQREFAKLLMAYCCLLVGFTICFCVVFPTPAFRNPLIGFVKVLAMMTGELDLNGLLVEQPPTGSPPRDLGASAYVAFVLFLFFVTIVLINLLVGIAVHDIEGLHKTAGLSKLVRQTELIYFLELALFHGYLPNCIMEWLKMAIFISPGGYRVVVSVRPYSPREKRLPKDVMEAALAIARARKKPCWAAAANGGASCENSVSVGGVAGAAACEGGADLKRKEESERLDGLLDELRKTQQMLRKLEEQRTLHKLLELADQIERQQAAGRNAKDVLKR